MKKKIVIMMMVALALIGIVGCSNSKVEANYFLPVEVVEIEEDAVVVEDADGYLWAFENNGTMKIGDNCTLGMYNNGTEQIFDDEIISINF